jgi:sec-independent protein translocase protein TatC
MQELEFWDHVRELGSRLKVALYSFIAFTILFLILPADFDLFNPSGFYKPLIGLILQIVKDQVLNGGIIGVKIEGIKLIGVEFSNPLEIYFIASLVLAFICSLPVTAYEIYKFIDPALYEHERRAVYPFVIAFSSMFAVGAAFGYFVIAPFILWAMLPFFSMVGAELLISVSDFYSLIFLSVVFTGLSFTIPVIYVLLVKLGILSTDIVKKNRRYLYAALFIITAVITPDGGPIADFALFIPIALMMEVAVRIAGRYEKERAFAPGRRCRFCGAEMGEGIFCPECGRSQI